jgi:hypothetical protein
MTEPESNVEANDRELESYEFSKYPIVYRVLAGGRKFYSMLCSLILIVNLLHLTLGHPTESNKWITGLIIRERGKGKTVKRGFEGRKRCEGRQK